MANWSKRRSRKSGTYSRTTTTTNSKGGSTRSTSTRVGNGPRITESIKQQNGKVTIRRHTTEYNPSLGTKRTTQTVYNTKQTKTPKPKKPRKVRASRSRSKYKASTLGYISAATPRDWVKHPRGSMWHDNHVFPQWCHWVFWIFVGYVGANLVISLLTFLLK
jgi:hypothetical protein